MEGESLLGQKFTVIFRVCVSVCVSVCVCVCVCMRARLCRLFLPPFDCVRQRGAIKGGQAVLASPTSVVCRTARPPYDSFLRLALSPLVQLVTN